ncbi:MAG: 3-deoxy-8-phosphooctulonate synthase [Desulfovibrionales bacterium]|nr:MAG: 3-deoxy-8-phosphooctulonate synthase [Desulfovibrionales bacterium]
MQQLYDRSVSGPFLIAGPCVLENLELALEVGEVLANIAVREQFPVIFKSSFDKANRSSLESFRGPGLELGMEWLAAIKERTGLPVITDIHEPRQAAIVAQVADVLQIPAFLCRQTDLLVAAGETGRIVNIKKGQFVAPWDLRPAIAKVRSTGNTRIWLTERGSSFGYNNLVVDYRSFPLLAQSGHPVIFDATHSVQLPGGKGHASDGQREFVPVLARAAVAAGCQGLFLEVHPRPEEALCDGPNSWPLDRLAPLLTDLLRIWRQTNVS